MPSVANSFGRVAMVISAAAAALLAATPAALAEPRRTLEPIRHGLQEQVGGQGCSSAQVSADIRGSQVVRARPDVGESVGLDAEVLAVTVESGRVVWTVGPDRESCELNDAVYGPGTWEWETWDDAWWEAVYRHRVYTVRAAAYGGVKSIAGFKVRLRSRRLAPTISRVKRALGRPTSVRRGQKRLDVVCTVRWGRLGLTARFVNFGAGLPCRDGLLQTATIAGGSAEEWTVRIGRDPGVATGTSLSYLDNEVIGEDDGFGRRLWTLAQVLVPYGDSGFIPAVSARFSGNGRLKPDDVIRGFELWVGGGGD